MYLNLSAALANIDPSLEEMAKILGAKGVRRYLDIVWPLARPGYIAGASIIFIWALTDLGTPLLVGFHEVIPVRIFNMVTDINENPVGFALVTVVILLTILFFFASKLFKNILCLSSTALGALFFLFTFGKSFYVGFHPIGSTILTLELNGTFPDLSGFFC